jgi:hypothetical protein
MPTFNLSNIFQRLVVVFGMAFGGGGVESGGVESGGVESGGVESGGVESRGSGDARDLGESSHTGDTDLFEDENDEATVKETTEEEATEEDLIDLSTSDVAPGRTFVSKAIAMKSLKEYFKKNYHPFISVSTFVPEFATKQLKFLSLLGQ